ncbi:MAG: recombinase family protein [Thermotogae bacterium]|jgi:site-specific DNA recombinase|nr:recombinase family protein [Thermotogota bacterium]MCL5033221.1 recombinase family protein [Thermotogota bacterium]
MTQASIYIRVSTDEQINGTSLEDQAEKCQAFCKAHGYEVVNVYRDEGFSAKNLDRPALQDALTHINDYDVLVFIKLDRLTRSMKDLTYLVQLFTEKNKGLQAVLEAFDTTSISGRLMLNVLGSFAQFERETIGLRTINGKIKRIKEGHWVQAAPYGYRKTGTYDLEIYESEAQAVRLMVDLYLHGNGCRKIANELNKLEIKPQSGKFWKENLIYNILFNPIYGGFTTWGVRKTLPNGKRLTRYPTKNDLIPVNVPKIINSNKVFQIMEERERRSKIPRRSLGNNNVLLTGLIYCEHCNIRMHVKRDPKKRKDAYFYYRCHYAGFNSCTLKFVNSSIEDEVWAQVKIHIHELLNAFDIEVIEQNHEHEIKSIERQIAKQKEAWNRYLDLYAMQMINLEELKEKKKSMEEEIEQLEAKAEILKQEDKSKEKKNMLKELESRINGVLTMEERKEVLSIFIYKIWVRQDKTFWIEWK